GGRKRLPPTATRDLRTDPIGRVLKPGHDTGFEYSDCGVDDARLVVLNARDAAARGATIRTRMKVTGARREGDGWAVDILDMLTGNTETISANMLINAAGPWIEQALPASADTHAVRLVKGSHIVVGRLYDDE